MILGILADTHISRLADGYRLAEQLLSGPFSCVSALIHAGDHVHPDLNQCFDPLPWYAVSGNMDRVSANRPISRLLQLHGKKIGVTHGWGSRHDIEERVIRAFSNDHPDVIVFGHSHMPLLKWVGQTLLFNPGSPTDKRSAPFHSVGLLHLSDQITGEIIRLD